jgi:hypothetical protein
MNTSITESITHHIKITLNEDEYVCDRQGTYFTDNNSFLSNVLTELGWISTSPYKYTKQKSYDDVFTLEATSQYQRRTGKIIGFDLTLGNIDSDDISDFENDIIVAIEKAVTDKQVTQNRPYVDCDRQGVYEVVTMIDNGVLKWPLINYIGTKDQCFQWVDKNPLAKGIVRRLVIGGPSQVEFDRQFMCTFD